jgi:polar amino acid transport system substrate-binding protein
MRIIDVPIPAIQKGYVLVRNHYSLISSGSEASTVKAARKGYIGKAIERPQQVKQVIDTLTTQGPVQTYRTVMKKLEAFSPLGYSCVGQVMDTGQNVKGIKVGDFVACGGLNASHAEVVCVPINLWAGGSSFRGKLRGHWFGPVGSINGYTPQSSRNSCNRHRC